MQSTSKTVAEYLASLPEDRRAAIDAVRKVIRQNLDKDLEEGMQYGMIGYFAPHRVYPAGYHCNPREPLPYAGLASQKNHMSMYMMAVYMNPEVESWLRKEWAKSGKKLDMGKACIRFKKLDDLPLDVIGKAFARVPLKDYIARYERNLNSSSRTKSTGTGAKAAPSAGSKKVAKKKVVKRSGTAKRKSA